MRITENENSYTTAERQYLVYRFLLENSDKDHVITKQQIIDYLSTWDIKVHINTLYSDLSVIASMYKVTIEYDQKKKGYRLKDTLFEPYEIRLIAHSIESFKFITDKKARSLIDRLKTITDRHTASSIHSDAYVPGRIHSNREEIADAADRIYQAIVEDKQIRCDFPFHVDKNENGEPVVKDMTIFISPYKLIWRDGVLSVLVYDHLLRDFTCYQINHLKNISKPLNLPREGKELYRKRLKNRKYDYDTFFNHESYDVRLRVMVFLASKFIEEYGSQVSIEPDVSWYCIVKLRITNKEGFFGWLISNCPNAEILFPSSLAAEMEEYIKNHIKYLNEIVLPMYKHDGEM